MEKLIANNRGEPINEAKNSAMIVEMVAIINASNIIFELLMMLCFINKKIPVHPMCTCLRVSQM